LVNLRAFYSICQDLNYKNIDMFSTGYLCQKSERKEYLSREVRSIEEKTHENTSEGSCDRNGCDPGEEQKTDTLEVDGFEGSVAETDSDSGTGDAHGGRDWERELGEDEDSDSGSHFHGATSAGGVVRDFVTHDYLDVSEVLKDGCTEIYPS
jgi:hypothetical protein